MLNNLFERIFDPNRPMWVNGSIFLGIPVGWVTIQYIHPALFYVPLIAWMWILAGDINAKIKERKLVHARNAMALGILERPDIGAAQDEMINHLRTGRNFAYLGMIVFIIVMGFMLGGIVV